MGRIDDLIQKYCLEGVEYVKLGDYCPVLRGKRLTKSQLSEEGKYKVFHGGIDPIGYYDQHNREANTAMVINVGASAVTVGFSKEEFWSSDGCFCLQHNKDVNNQFLFYYLQTQEYLLKSRVRHAGIPTLDGQVIEKIEFPLPPLPIQEAIVEILEKFDRLSAELQAELQARKQQYEYYRNQLLTRFAPEQPVTEYSLGDICDTLSGFPFDSTQFQDNGIRLMRGMNIKRGFLDFSEENNRYWDSTAGLEKYLLEDQDIVMSMDGSLVGKSFGIIEKKDLPLILVQRVARIRSTKANIRYIYYCITNFFPDYVDKKKTGGAIPHISMKDINNFKIVLPSLEEQARIVAILDKFEALVNDLSQGLPAEIAAVQEQYEYYRNKLLTFKTKE